MIDSLINALVSPIRETFFQKALIGGSVAAIVCSVVGCLVILRRMAFLGDALSHAMIAGVAGGYLFMKLVFTTESHAPAMLVGSLIAAVITVASIGFVSKVSRIKDDTAIGIMYTGIFAAGVVLVSIFRNYIHIDLMHFIMGDVLGVADSDLWVAAISAALVLSIIVLFFRYFQVVGFDPVMAASIGMPVLLIDYALTTCVSLVVVSAVSMVGVILVVGLLITPAATAYLLSDRLDRMMVLSALFGVSSVFGGLYLSVWLDSAGGGAVMLFCTLQFLLVLVFAPRYGLLSGRLRKRRMVPQQLVEDVLGTVLRAQGVPVSSDAISRGLGGHAQLLPNALKSMTRDGLLLKQPDGYVLSEKGSLEAARILRAHRLWETYLKHVGMATEDIHNRAHDLEHFHDKESIDYLDDLLGHPVRDPHGKEIPINHSECAPGKTCPVGMLRKGISGLVESLLPGAPDELKIGKLVTIGPRSDDGKEWSLLINDGKTVIMNHQAADAVIIKIVGNENDPSVERSGT